MGQKTSVYLTDETAERVKASGLTLGELIRRGLDLADFLDAAVRQAVREEFARERSSES